MNIKTTKEMLQYIKKTNDVALIKGLHGIGKSSIIKQYCKENGYNYQELIISLMEPSDLIGMPVAKNNKTTWFSPDWFNEITYKAFPTCKFRDLNFKDPKFAEFCRRRLDIVDDNNIVDLDILNEAYKQFFNKFDDKFFLTTNQDDVTNELSQESVLFLDEFNRGQLDSRQACMQLVLEKKLHNHVLPFVRGQQTQIVAAINPADDDSVDFQVQELDPALLDRFIELDVEVDVQAWLKYASDVNLNKIVRAFIVDNNKLLHFVPQDGGTSATPRSWEMLAKYVDEFETTPKEFHYNICKGKVGSAIGSQFLNYYYEFAKSITIADIEKLVKEESKNTSDMDVLGDKVKMLLKDEESIKKADLLEQLYNKYKDKVTGESLPLLATMYAMETEIIMSFIQDKKKTDDEGFRKVVKFDQEVNGRQLFIRLAKHVGLK